MFDRVVDRIELAGHTPNDCRDTFATIHLTDDWNRLGWVSAQLGHEKVTTTENHYYKAADRGLQEVANLVSVTIVDA
jgi:integrase